MGHLYVTTRIGAPPAIVWDVLSDLERQREWMVDVRQLDVMSAQKRGVGAVMHVTSELFGLPVVRDVMEVTAWEPPHRMDVLHRGQFHGTGSFLLTDADGGTLMRWIEDFEAPLGQVGELAFVLVVAPHLRRVFGRSLVNLRRISERAAGARANGRSRKE